MKKVLVFSLIFICCTLLVMGCSNIAQSGDDVVAQNPTNNTVPSTESTKIPTFVEDEIVDTQPTQVAIEDETMDTQPTQATTEPHEHNYESVVTTATCEKNGFTTYKCSCGDSYVDNQIDAIGHNYNKITVKASCTTDGYTQFTCDLCKHSYRENGPRAFGHKYITKTVDPTYTQKGYDLHSCSNCDHSYKNNYKDIIPHEHQYNEEVISPTCTTGGYTVHNCEKCAESYKDSETKALEHDYDVQTIAPTNKTKGYDLYTCKRCAYEYKDNYKDPVITYKEVDEIVYAKSTVNIRKGPSTDFKKIGSLEKGKSVTRIGIGDNGWSKVLYNDEVAYIHSDYLTTEKPPVVSGNGYPKTYSDETCKITITKEKHYGNWCYIAHLKFSDYTRFGSICAKDKLGGYETTSHAAKRIGAIFAVNGPYMQDKSYSVIRSGKVFNDIAIIDDLGIYNAKTGVFANAGSLGLTGIMASEAVELGQATDTFKFYNSTLVKDGKNVANPNNYDKAQRTFIATTGSPGDLYIVVAEGRCADGSSPGLTKYECAKLILDLGCNYGVMLDGGGSSTMYFNGKVLNSANGGQRSVVDFLYFQ